MDPKNIKPDEELKKEEIIEEPIEVVQEENPVEKERDDFKSKYLRALADYHNLEKRVQQERIGLREDAKRLLFVQLLPFLDQLSQAEVFIKDPGLKMIKDQYDRTLQEMGLTEIKVLNKEFDPHLAEAIDVVEGDKDNIVVEVLRKGYKFHDEILRVAQVKVSKKKAIDA